MLRKLLVQLDGTPLDRLRLDHAAALADRFGAHLSGLLLHEQPEILSMSSPSGSAFLRDLLARSEAASISGIAVSGGCGAALIEHLPGLEIIASLLPWQPVIDGRVLPQHPVERIAAGAPGRAGRHEPQRALGSATATDGIEEQRTLALFNGREAVGLEIKKTKGYSTTAVAEAILAIAVAPVAQLLGDIAFLGNEPARGVGEHRLIFVVIQGHWFSLSRKFLNVIPGLTRDRCDFGAKGDSGPGSSPGRR